MSLDSAPVMTYTGTFPSASRSAILRARTMLKPACGDTCSFAGQQSEVSDTSNWRHSYFAGEKLFTFIYKI
jgi:hypothetical protein